VSLLSHDQFENGAPAVTVHRLVQAVARRRPGTNKDAQDILARVIARLSAIYPLDGKPMNDLGADGAPQA
jgi:hypothetical protein